MWKNCIVPFPRELHQKNEDEQVAAIKEATVEEGRGGKGRERNRVRREFSHTALGSAQQDAHLLIILFKILSHHMPISSSWECQFTGPE